MNQMHLLSLTLFLTITFAFYYLFGTIVFNIIKASINFCVAANDISGLKDVLRQERNCNASSVIEKMVDGKALAEQMKLDEPRMGQKKNDVWRSD